MILCAGSIAVSSLTAQAQDISGSDAPEFLDTVAAWLSGEDDLAALQSLSTLAYAENTAAQILMARISRDWYNASHFTQGLTRAEVAALLGHPGGLTGRSWMKRAAETEPLAQAFLNTANPQDRGAGTRLLFVAGEVAAATRSLPVLLSAYGPEDFLTALDDLDAMPDEARFRLTTTVMRPMSWANGQPIEEVNPMSDRSPPDLSLVWRPILPEQWRDNVTLRTLALEASPHIASLAPIHDLCLRACPSDVAACTATGASLIASRAVLLPFSSPAESLISTADYWDSPRFQADAMRLLGRLVVPEHQPEYVAMNACFMEAASD